MSTGISSPSDSIVITSPTFSPSSLSSSGFNLVGVRQRSTESEQLSNTHAILGSTLVRPRPTVIQPGEDSSFSDDDDIVWGISESEDLEGSTSELRAALSDDDFVVLSRTRPAGPTSRTRARTSETAGSQTGTIRGAPLPSELLEPHPSVDYPQGTDFTAETLRGRDDKDMITSELAKELAKLNVNAEPPLGEAHGTQTPVAHDLRQPEQSAPGPLPKKKGKKAKKVRTEEEEALRRQRKKERKEKKAKEKEAAKALRKAKEKEKKSNISPELSKSASTATLVPSSRATVNSTTPRAVVPPKEATPVRPTASAPLEPVKTPTTVPKPLDSPKKRKKKAKKVKATGSTISTQPNVVLGEEARGTGTTPTPYDEAFGYITSYISNISARNDPTCHLTLLQSLIIELGLIKDVTLLPRSIKAAKKFIKLRVFLNIKEYLKKRHEGPEIVKGLMFPSRSALVKDMREKKNFASLKWIKNHGLQDLLVGVFRH